MNLGEWIALRQMAYTRDLAEMKFSDRPVCEYPGCESRVSGLAVVMMEGELIYLEMCMKHVYLESKEWNPRSECND